MRNQILQQGHDLIAQRLSDALSMEQLIVHIPIEYIMHCTDNFSLSNRLGEGRFGQVFKAQDGDQVFVVKLLNDDGMKSFRTEKEVRNLLEMSLSYYQSFITQYTKSMDMSFRCFNAYTIKVLLDYLERQHMDDRRF